MTQLRFGSVYYSQYKGRVGYIGAEMKETFIRTLFSIKMKISLYINKAQILIF